MTEVLFTAALVVAGLQLTLWLLSLPLRNASIVGAFFPRPPRGRRGADPSPDPS